MQEVPVRFPSEPYGKITCCLYLAKLLHIPKEAQMCAMRIPSLILLLQITRPFVTLFCKLCTFWESISTNCVPFWEFISADYVPLGIYFCKPCTFWEYLAPSPLRPGDAMLSQAVVLSVPLIGRDQVSVVIVGKQLHCIRVVDSIHWPWMNINA